jgi:hypothetical protein
VVVAAQPEADDGKIDPVVCADYPCPSWPGSSNCCAIAGIFHKIAARYGACWKILQYIHGYSFRDTYSSCFRVAYRKGSIFKEILIQKPIAESDFTALCIHSRRFACQGLPDGVRTLNGYRGGPERSGTTQRPDLMICCAGPNIHSLGARPVA